MEQRGGSRPPAKQNQTLKYDSPNSPQRPRPQSQIHGKILLILPHWRLSLRPQSLVYGSHPPNTPPLHTHPKKKEIPKRITHHNGVFVNEATTPFNYNNNIWDVAFTKWQERERERERCLCLFLHSFTPLSLYPFARQWPPPLICHTLFGVKEALSPVTRSNDVPVLPSPESP